MNKYQGGNNREQIKIGLRCKGFIQLYPTLYSRPSISAAFNVPRALVEINPGLCFNGP